MQAHVGRVRLSEVLPGLQFAPYDNVHTLGGPIGKDDTIMDEAAFSI